MHGLQRARLAVAVVEEAAARAEGVVGQGALVGGWDVCCGQSTFGLKHDYIQTMYSDTRLQHAQGLQDRRTLLRLLSEADGVRRVE